MTFHADGYFSEQMRTGERYDPLRINAGAPKVPSPSKTEGPERPLSPEEVVRLTELCEEADLETTTS